ncbi:hypothetical protein V7O66_12120 [Methanolobus sp. ZRKC3]|uniref:hypothetical protein n=1 Tax=Methanolobus sp. ZRKC3 TaxID=3125786 RepID=UPI003247038D
MCTIDGAVFHNRITKIKLSSVTTIKIGVKRKARSVVEMTNESYKVWWYDMI